MATEATVAVIGCGFMGRNHAHAISDHPTLSLSTVVDVDPDAATDVATTFGAESASTDYESAIASSDAVVVASPEFAHAEQARTALAHDRHLLLEKPPTEDTDVAWNLAARAADTDAATGVSFILRYDPGYSRARDVVTEGAIGDPVAARARRAITVEESRRIGRRGHPAQYLTIHDIDAMRWIVGSGVERVMATERRGVLTDIDVPDAMQAVFEFTNGAVGTLEGYGILPADTPGGIDAALEVVGTDGTASVETPGTTLTVHGERYDRPDVRHWPVVNGRMAGAVRRQIDWFARAIAGETTLLASLTDGAKAQTVADVVRTAAETGEPQSVPSR